MNIRRATMAAVAFGLLVLGTPVASQTTDALPERCSNANGELTNDLMIQACTAMIESGRYQGELLIFAHRNRAIAYADQEDSERAILDYTEVIRLSPQDPDGYYARAFSYRRQGEHARAIADFSKAIEHMGQALQFTYELRGEAHGALGDTGGQAADREAEQIIWTLANR